MEKLITRLERFFMLFLFINPFLDLLAGVYLNLAQTYSLPSITPSLIIRMGVLALFALYVILRRHWRSAMVMVPLAAAWLLSLLGEVIYYYGIDLFQDLQYIVRFAFNIAVILVYALVFKHSGLHRKELFNRLNQALVFAANLLAGSIVLSYIFGMGASTYGDRFGYRGTRGFFFSGNDITAVLMLLLPMTFCFVYQLSRRAGWKRILWHVAAPSFTLVALLLIGTKTAFLAIGGAVAAMLGYAIYALIKEKNRLILIRFGWVCLGFALVFGFLMLISQASLASDIRKSLTITSSIYADSGLTSTLVSGRQHKLQKALSMMKKTSPYAFLFGMGRGTQPKVIEMDIFEVMAYYGLFGTVAMLWLYLKLGLGFVFKAFKRFDLTGLALLCSLGLCVGYLTIAGHVLFSVTSGFYFALILLYAQLYYTSSPRKVRVV